MQTFLPFPNFDESAQALDRQRLGKQRVENLQIMAALLHCRVISVDSSGKQIPRESWRVEPVRQVGWAQHPAIRMWRGHELAFLLYQVAMVNEWERRGYADTCLPKTALMYHFNAQYLEGIPFLPHWIGDEEFHISHQSNLVRKDQEHYGPLFPGVPDDLPYIWPTQQE